jgi:ribosomal protein L24E
MEPQTSTTICSFCGKEFPRKHLCVSGDKTICYHCVQSAKQIIAAAQAEYVCSFCGKTVPGSLLVEGPGVIHMCAECVTRADQWFEQ